MIELTLCELTETDEAGLESWSPFCLKVRRALALHGLPFTSRRAPDPGAWRALNPTGQVPVLLVGAEPVADSTRILARLEALGAGTLVPEGAVAEAEAWLWEELADAALNGFVMAARWADEENWPRVREAFFAGVPAPARQQVSGQMREAVVGVLVARDVWRAGPHACWVRFEGLLDRLEARAPEEGFWCGPSPSVADVALYGQLQSLRSALTPWQRAQVERRPRLLAWLERVRVAEPSSVARRRSAA